MSCTTSAVWSRTVSSPCYTEHGQRCGAILSGRITTVAMSRCGLLDPVLLAWSNCQSSLAGLQLSGLPAQGTGRGRVCDPTRSLHAGAAWCLPAARCPRWKTTARVSTDFERRTCRARSQGWGLTEEVA
jgi:hypothetical protein